MSVVLLPVAFWTPLEPGPGYCANLCRWGQQKNPCFVTVAMQTMVHVTDKCPLFRFHGGLVTLNSGELWELGVRSYCLMQKEGTFARESPHRNWVGVEWVDDDVTGMEELRFSLHSPWLLRTCFSLGDSELVVQFHYCRVSFQGSAQQAVCSLPGNCPFAGDTRTELTHCVTPRNL